MVALNELICKAEIESQMQRSNIWAPKRGVGGGMYWEIGIDVYTIATMSKIDK